MHIYCPDCEAANAEDAAMCGQCGHQLIKEVAPQGGRRRRKVYGERRADVDYSGTMTSTHAVWSLICGILCFLFAGLPLGIIAIVLGTVALRDIDNNPERVSGAAMAVTGRWLGILGVILGAIVLVIAVAFYLDKSVL